MNNGIFNLIDILGTAAFSISGVFAAMEKKLDIFGIFLIAFITAIGGGTIRDVMTGDTPVNWMRASTYPLVIFCSAAVTVWFYKLVKNLGKTLLVFDSIGLGFFTLVGIHKGLEFNFSNGLCIALGTITACFGGLIRDIILNQIPHILQKEIYATACIAGGLLYFGLRQTALTDTWLDSICITVIVLIRLLAVKFRWKLPGIYR